jgi:hypothetical protein
VRRADEPLCDSICSIAPMPAVRQKRSNELSTSCQANSRLGKSGIRAIIRVSHVSKAIILALSPHPVMPRPVWKSQSSVQQLLHDAGDLDPITYLTLLQEMIRDHFT